MGDDEQPFSNGTSYQLWSERNCERCAKGHDGKQHHCDLQAALDLSAIGEPFPAAMLARIGGAAERAQGRAWRCGEFVRAEGLGLERMTP